MKLRHTLKLIPLLFVFAGSGIKAEESDFESQKKLAEQEYYLDAQVTLALKYVIGIGVPHDYKEAFNLFTEAAEQGHARAQYFLGLMYIEDKGVPQNYVQAYKWWNLAATNGYEDAKKERDIISEIMTPEQIAEAQKLAEEWHQEHQNKE